MQVRYFVHHEGKSIGPYSCDEISRLYGSSDLFPTDYVYMAERADWISIMDFIKSNPAQTRTLTGRRKDDEFFAYPVLTTQVLPEVLGPIPELPPPSKLMRGPRTTPLQKQQNLQQQQSPQATNPTKPTTKPTKPITYKAEYKLDLSAKITLEIKPGRASRLEIEATGGSRVGEYLDVVVRAVDDRSSIDVEFAERVFLRCNRRVEGLGLLKFVNGVAHQRLLCLESGTYELTLASTE